MSEQNGGQIARATVIDVPMSGQRSLATVTAEIRAYQDAARRMAITYCIEVGRRLVEAKSMVAHGEWGTYLREELGYSQSRANDLMRLFDAYAADQMRLDGDNLKSQAFGNLSYTQALALLALPSEEEREAFVESHDMSAMSTRELREELRRRDQRAEDEPTREELADRLDKALNEIREQENELRNMKDKVRTALEDRDKAEAGEDQEYQRANALKIERDNLRDQVSTAQTERDRAQAASAEAERKAKEAADKLASLQAELDKARKAEEKALKDLHKAQKDKTVPPEVLEKLKKEAEAAAAASYKADSETLDAAKKERARAEIELDKARREAAAAADKVTAMQKELALAAPELAVFRARFERVQTELSTLVESVATLPEDKRPGARRGLAALLQKAHEQIGGGEDG